jgi:hypothetical protein
MASGMDASMNLCSFICGLGGLESRPNAQRDFPRIALVNQ